MDQCQRDKNQEHISYHCKKCCTRTIINNRRSNIDYKRKYKIAKRVGIK